MVESPYYKQDDASFSMDFGSGVSEEGSSLRALEELREKHKNLHIQLEQMKERYKALKDSNEMNNIIRRSSLGFAAKLLFIHHYESGEVSLYRLHSSFEYPERVCIGKYSREQLESLISSASEAIDAIDDRTEIAPIAFDINRTKKALEAYGSDWRAAIPHAIIEAIAKSLPSKYFNISHENIVIAEMTRNQLVLFLERAFKWAETPIGQTEES